MQQPCFLRGVGGEDFLLNHFNHFKIEKVKQLLQHFTLVIDVAKTFFVTF